MYIILPATGTVELLAECICNVQNVNFSMIYVYCGYIKLSDCGARLYTAPHWKPHHKCLRLITTLNMAL